jgi:hypothetical protein
MRAARVLCCEGAATVALVKPARGSTPYQAKNSSRPRLYTRRVIGEETLSSLGPGKNRGHTEEELGSGSGWGKLVGSTGYGSRPNVQWRC